MGTIIDSIEGQRQCKDYTVYCRHATVMNKIKSTRPNSIDD